MPAPAVGKVATEPAVSEPASPRPPPPKLLYVAWMKAGAGEGGFAEAIDVRADGSVIVGGEGDLNAWLDKRKARLNAPFVALLDARGDLVWARRFDAHEGTIRAVHAFGDGVVVCGDFQRVLKLAGKTLAKSNGVHDLFVATLDKAGKLGWVFTAGSDNYDSCNDLAILPDGRVAITGTLSGPARFGTLAAQSFGFRDAYVVVLDAKGSPDWVAVGGGMLDEESRAITVSGDGIYITGNYGGAAKFGAFAVDLVPSRQLANPSNAFVARYSFAGDITFLETLGVENSFDRGWAIAGLSDGGVAVTGNVKDHPFLARYTAAGKRLWIKNASAGVARALVALPNDDLIAAYFFGGQADEMQFDDNPPTKLVATSGDSAIARYSADGTLLGTGRFVGRVPGQNDERGDEVDVTDIARTASGRVVFSGRLVGTAAVEGGRVFRESPAQITAKAFQELVIVAAD